MAATDLLSRFQHSKDKSKNFHWNKKYNFIVFFTEDENKKISKRYIL